MSKTTSIALLILAALIGTYAFLIRPQLALADISTAYVAKQVCSCHHVGERTLESCLGDFTEDVSRLDVSDDGTTTRASVLWLSASARHTPGRGCALVAD